MQLELFCAEETVRGYEQRIAAHAEREHIIGLLATSRGEHPAQQYAAGPLRLAFRIEAAFRHRYLRWCRAMPRRWSPCAALS